MDDVMRPPRRERRQIKAPTPQPEPRVLKRRARYASLRLALTAVIPPDFNCAGT